MEIEAGKEPIHIYVAGACRGNPGPGGYGIVMQRNSRSRELSGRSTKTTSNRAELAAAIAAMRDLSKPRKIMIITSSKYMLDSFTKWLPIWKQNGWINTEGEAVKNKDLWQKMDLAAERHEVQIVWQMSGKASGSLSRAKTLASMALPPA